MSDFKQYTVADYLADGSFINYLLRKNEADVALWQQRQAEGLLQEETLHQATQFFFALREQSRVTAADKAAELKKLQQLIAAQKQAPLTPVVPLQAKRSRFLWPAVAASVIILILVTWFFLPGSNNSATPVKEFVSFAASTTSNQKIVQLPDGSKVILNGHSSVSLAPGFNQSKREVLLNGTAFFQVAKDPARPFTVISGKVSTTALGTSFYIHQSSNAAPTTVSLLTGKVRVEVAGQAPIHLVPYEKGIYHQSQELEKSTFNQEALVNWTKGLVVFDKANWEQVKDIIEEYFDKKLVIGNVQKDISFTGEFKAGQLESILSSLEFTYDLKYRINNQTVNITF